MLGLLRALHVAPDAANGFVHDISALRDFPADTRRDDASVQVLVPKVSSLPPSDVVLLGADTLHESASMKAKRIALQCKGAAAMIVAEEYARRFESTNVVLSTDEILMLNA